MSILFRRLAWWSGVGACAVLMLFVGLNVVVFASCCSTVWKVAGVERPPRDYVISNEQVELVGRMMSPTEINNHIGRQLFSKYAIRSQVALFDLATVAVWLAFPSWYSYEDKVFLAFYLSPGVDGGRGAAGVARQMFGKRLSELSEKELYCMVRYIRFPLKTRLEECVKASKNTKIR